MTNSSNEPTRLDRIEQKIEELARSLDEERQQRQRIRNLTEPYADISASELRQKITKLHAEATQRLEAGIAADQSAPKPVKRPSSIELSTEQSDSWQAESERHRALMQQKLEKLAEQRKTEKAKLDRLDQSFKTIRLLAWLSFTLILCASTTVILTTIKAGKP